MSSRPNPTASEVLDVLDRLQRSAGRRTSLQTSHGLFTECVAEGVVSSEAMDWWARCMQELVTDELIAYGATSRGAPPAPAIWSGASIQQISDWRVTAHGRADAATYRNENARLTDVETFTPPVHTPASTGIDLFISHASEDKAQVARPLALALESLGFKVWLDENELTVGDSLSRRIDEALAMARFGVVVLSPAFFAKEWPQRELGGLAAREVDAGAKMVLPVWHQVDHAYILGRSPMLADRLGTKTDQGIDQAAREIARAVVAADRRTGRDGNKPVLQSLDSDASTSTVLLSVPNTAEETAPVTCESTGRLAVPVFRWCISAGDGGSSDEAARPRVPIAGRTTATD